MNGTLTRNEARLMEDRDPLPGLDDPLRMLNMVTESDAQEDQAEAEATEAAALLAPALAAPEPAEPNPADARLHAMAGAAAERVVRKEVEMLARAAKSGQAAIIEAYQKHAVFVAGAIGISTAQAQAYCIRQVELVAIDIHLDTDYFALLARAKLEQLAIQG